jgi:hypothetical protein
MVCEGVLGYGYAYQKPKATSNDKLGKKEQGNPHNTTQILLF